jgi:hypothetical protein
LKKYFSLSKAQDALHSIGDFWILGGIPTAVAAFIRLPLVVGTKRGTRKLENMFFTRLRPSTKQSEFDKSLFLKKLKQYKVNVICNNINCGFLKAPVKGGRPISNIIM